MPNVVLVLSPIELGVRFGSRIQCRQACLDAVEHVYELMVHPGSYQCNLTLNWTTRDRPSVLPGERFPKLDCVVNAGTLLLVSDVVLNAFTKL